MHSDLIRIAMREVEKVTKDPERQRFLLEMLELRLIYVESGQAERKEMEKNFEEYLLECGLSREKAAPFLKVMKGSRNIEGVIYL